jgi:hypothetical protein
MFWFLVWPCINTINWNTINWEAVAAIATCVLAGGIGVAIWQIVVTRKNTNRQLEEARKSTNAQLAVELFRELRNKEALEIFRFIYTLKPQEEVKSLPAVDRHNIDYLLDRFDLLGKLVNRKIIDKPLAVESFGGPRVLRCWFQLGHYIRQVQSERGYYVVNYEDFTHQTLKYLDNEGAKVGFKNPQVTPPVTIEDLVQELKERENERDETKPYPRSLEHIQGEWKTANKDKREV